MRKKDFADLPEGGDSPLNSAVAARDTSTVQMATEAVKHQQCRLAFQPVMQALANARVVSQFELIKPTLHDIFVRIAGDV